MTQETDLPLSAQSTTGWMEMNCVTCGKKRKTEGREGQATRKTAGTAITGKVMCGSEREER